MTLRLPNKLKTILFCVLLDMAKCSMRLALFLAYSIAAAFWILLWLSSMMMLIMMISFYFEIIFFTLNGQFQFHLIYFSSNTFKRFPSTNECGPVFVVLKIEKQKMACVIAKMWIKNIKAFFSSINNMFTYQWA